MSYPRLRLWTVLALTLVVVVGCAKKAPQTQPEVSANPVVTPAPPTDVNSNPRPAVSDQLANDPLKDPDLAKLNRYVWDNGLLGDVYFDFDKSELREDARERLARNAEWLRSHPEFEVTLEGHCDERGTNEYNLALGERRAAAARDYIVSLGVPANRLRTITYGEERPQCTASDESCWAKNRRAHFLVSGRLNVG